jgi:hypothetical protein
MIDQGSRVRFRSGTLPEDGENSALFNKYVPKKDIPPCGTGSIVFIQILGVFIVAIITFHEANMEAKKKPFTSFLESKSNR